MIGVARRHWTFRKLKSLTKAMSMKNIFRFSPAVAIVLLAALLCQAPAAESVAPAKPLTEAERAAFLAELRPLQDRLAELRKAPNMSPDRWADAEIFVKGVIWALDFGPV